MPAWSPCMVRGRCRRRQGRRRRRCGRCRQRGRRGRQQARHSAAARRRRAAAAQEGLTWRRTPRQLVEEITRKIWIVSSRLQDLTRDRRRRVEPPRAPEQGGSHDAVRSRRADDVPAGTPAERLRGRAVRDRARPEGLVRQGPRHGSVPSEDPGGVEPHRLRSRSAWRHRSPSPATWTSAGPIDIEGPLGRIHLEHGAMVAARHVHMGPATRRSSGLKDQDLVKFAFGGERGGVLDNFIVRLKDEWVPEIHLDTDEANALGLTRRRFRKADQEVSCDHGPDPEHRDARSGDPPLRASWCAPVRSTSRRRHRGWASTSVPRTSSCRWWTR